MDDENSGCLTILLKLIGVDVQPTEESGTEDHLPFQLRDRFLSPAELSFFHVLRRTIEDRLIITTKVRVSDLVYVVRRRENMKHANRIDRKHVDFVLCDAKTMQPRLIIELDDSSHSQEDRKARDELIDAVFSAANLPILHVKAQKSYSRKEISQNIDAILSNDRLETHSPPKNEQGSTDPSCPNCEVPMVQRQTRTGPNKGKRFWGCPSYPDCRKTIPID